MAGKTIELKPNWKFAAKGMIRLISSTNTQMNKATMKDLEDLMWNMAQVADMYVEAVEEAEAIVDKGVGKLLKEKLKGAN